MDQRVPVASWRSLWGREVGVGVAGDQCEVQG